MSSEMRRLRREAGLTQADLARAAGLSRQLVGAVESGRHVPSVAAALALAEILGRSVEDLFGTAPRAHTSALGEDVSDGTPVVAALVGDMLSYASLPDHGAEAASWRRADGICSGGRIRLFPEASTSGFLVSGCDPALGLAAALAPPSGARRIIAVHGSSGRSLEALANGRLHAALVHGTRAAGVDQAVSGERLTIARWEVGVAVRPGAEVDLGAIADGSLVVARRGAGAEAQRALERALEPYAEHPILRGPVAAGHIEAVRRVAFGGVDAGVTMRPAAASFGLDFLAVIDERWNDHAGAATLVDIFTSRAFKERIDPLPGYNLSTA
jgi:DNA-binding XRE family transcriptional regulator/molybdate-binding protein